MQFASNQKAAETSRASSKTGRRDLPPEALRGICLISVLQEFIFVVSDTAYLRGFFLLSKLILESFRNSKAFGMLSVKEN